MKKIVSLALILLLLTGCSISKVQDESFDSVINTVLYKDTDLFNVSFDGYKFYTPRTTSLEEKREYNLEIKDKDNTYYLYISPIEYYYKTKVKHNVDNNIFYSRNLNYKNNNGYVDITKVDNKYFIEFIYNYAKIEAYVPYNNLDNVFLNICYILSTIRFNDSIINYKFSNHEFDSTTEEFSIFKSKKDNDNFLKYVEEYDKYNNNGQTKARDEDVIETNEGE